VSDFLKQISGLSPARLALLAKELKDRLDQAERARTEAIAVVGLSCRFPGDSNTPDEFWRLVRDGRDAVVEVPRDRWDIERYYDEDREAPGKMYAREGGFLSDVSGFDARFFGVSPREAVSLDPQHRLLLEVSWEALENAGWAPAALLGSNTGVFVGITATDYAERLGWAGDEQIDAYRLTGNPLNFAAGRLAYTLGLQGPALAVDTACSSSLVAIHLACLSLRAGNCRMALAGGVNLILTPQNSVTTCKAQMLSPDGRCKTFDEAADGIGRAEGCGMVVLKRLSDALADRDHIHLVIRGSAVNQDGRSSGLTVPNGLAQQAVIRAALAEAGVAPADVSYIEAHGTGTSLGDPIELGALAAVFGGDREAGRPLWVGSVKTNIGHAESAAGVAGLIKVALALRHGTIPAHLHLRKPTTRFDWDRHPLCVPRDAVPWPGGRPRIAGISSFGGSGTNAHLVVAEAPSRAPQEDGRKVHSLTLSAKTASGLAELERRFAAHLEQREPGELADICYTTNIGRNHFRHRLTAVAETLPDLVARLRDATTGSSAALWRTESAGPPPVAFLFTGQGAQYARMGHALYHGHPTYRAALDQCAALLAPELDRPLLELLFPAAGDEALLDQTVYTQPCLFAVEYALAELWRCCGIEPAFVLGHSLGEYVGACIAGILSLPDALKLVVARSRLMQALPPNGTMVAVFAGEARVAELIGPDAAEVGIAAVNGPENTVVSGRTDAVQRVCRRLEQHGVSQQPLKVSHAFHSRQVAPMLAEFEQVARAVSFGAPRLPLVSNVTGRLVKGREASDARYWVEHARNAVRFADGLRTLADQGVRWFLEVGPHPTLSGIAAAFGPADATFLPSLGRGRDDWATLTMSAARLHAAGVELRWSEFHRGAARGRTALPVYPFERQRFWIDVPAEGPAPRSWTPAAHPLLGRRLASPLETAQFSNTLGAEALPWLADHRVLGRLLLPAAAHIEMAWAAARDFAGQDPTSLEDVVIGQALVIPDSGSRATQLVLQAPVEDAATFEVFSEEVAGTSRRWSSHATGRLLFGPSRHGSVPVEGLASLRGRLAERVEPQALYERLEAHGFAFGPCFRNLVDIRRSGHEALGRARLEDSLRTEAASYRIHPALLDACLQVFAVAAHAPDGAATSPVYLPLSIERFELLRAAGDELFSHARFRSAVEPQRDTLTGDLDLYDAGGGHVGLLRGLHLKRIDPASFGTELRPAWRDWLYALRWREAPPVHAAPLPDLAAIAAEVEPDVARDYDAHGLADYNEILPELDRLCAEYIIEALRSLGEEPVAGTALGLGEVVERYGIQASQRPLTARLLDILAEDGLLQKVGKEWRWVRKLAPARPEERAARLRKRHAAIRPEIELLERCGGNLADVLRGRIDPLQLLFPAGGLSSAEKIYGASPFARFYANLIRKTIARLVGALPPSAALRVLEIGGGTGGTTSAVLPALPANRTAYTFTDISAQFTKAARQKFGQFPFVDYRLLDIGRDPSAQGFPPGEFDLVIAANVLHATRDLRQTMRYVRQLLRPGGALLMLETTRPQRYGDLTVGFTEGWWLFSDRDLRPDYPLLDQARWRTLLEELAFSRIAIVPGRVPPTDQVDLLAQQSIIVANVAAAGEAETPSPPGSRWLIFGDEGGLGGRVHQALAAAPGSRSLLVEEGACHDILAPDRCRLSADDPASFDRLLRTAGDTQPVTGIVYLWGLDARADDSATAEDVGAAVRRACAGLLQIVRACAASGLAPRLWVCTRGAEAVLDGQSSVSAEQATLWGLGRVIALEHPEFECVRIDLDPEAAPEEAGRLLASLAADAGEDQVAWRGTQRWLPRLEPYVDRAAAATPAAGSRPNGFDADGTYLVTGGLGGLGLSVASWMAEKGARSLVLMGRTAPGREALEIIDSLRARQTAVEIALGDVGNPSDVARTLAAIADAGRPLRGVFHAAGELDDGALVSLTWERFRRVMNAKVAGTWNLHRQTRHLPLDHFVLFSSATGLLGSPGQGNHAAANAYLDAIAELRRRQGLPAISIDWGAWSRIGAAARRQVGERVAVQGIGSIEPQEGLAVLEFLLRSDPARVAVIPIDWPRFLKAFTGDRIPAFLRGWMRDTDKRPARDSARQSGEAFRGRFAAAPAGRKPALLLELVRAEVARVLGWRPDEPIELRQPFTDLGLDSLMAVELRNSLGALLGRSFPATILFDHPTVEALAAFLLDDLTDAAAKPVATGSAAPDTSGLDHLSEAELADVLASKLAALSDGEGA
jgi:acyl transferase domain-containing protein/ubiquinone/menaquinone biosynthesis C-methylase UbiE/acyl carrier protein